MQEPEYFVEMANDRWDTAIVVDWSLFEDHFVEIKSKDMQMQDPICLQDVQQFSRKDFVSIKENELNWKKKKMCVYS